MKAGALLFPSGMDQLTEEGRPDISHCFPAMHTHTQKEEQRAASWVYPQRSHGRIYVTVSGDDIPVGHTMTTQSSREETYRRGLARALRQERCAAKVSSSSSSSSSSPSRRALGIFDTTFDCDHAVSSHVPAGFLPGPEVSGEVRPAAGVMLPSDGGNERGVTPG